MRDIRGDLQERANTIKVLHTINSKNGSCSSS